MEYENREDLYDEYSKYSASVLKAKDVTQGESVFGYAPSEKEKKDNLIPVETMRMKNSDGTVSVGIDRKNEATLTITGDSPGPYLRRDREEINRNSSTQIKQTNSKVYVNSHDQKVSGIAYKAELSKSPTNMLLELKRVLERQENEVASGTIPFLFTRKDKERKAQLENYMRELIEARQLEERQLGGGLAEKRRQEMKEHAKNELDRLNVKIALKEREEVRLLSQLTSTISKMKSEAKRLAGYEIQATAINLTEPDPEQDTADEDSEGENIKVVED